MAEEFQDVVLRYRIDKSELTKAVQGTNQLKKAITDTADAVRSRFAVATTELNKRLESTKSLSKGATEGMRALRKEMVEAEQAAKRLAGAQGLQALKDARQSGGSGGSRLAAIGGQSGAANSLARLAGSVGGSEAAEPLRLAGDFIGTLTTLGPLAAASAVGIGAVSLALGEYNRGLEEQRRAIQAQITATRNYYELLGSGAGTEDAKKRVEELQRLSAQEQNILDANQRALADNFQSNQEVYGDLSARLGNVFNSLDDDLQKPIDESKQRLADYAKEIDLLNIGLNLSVFTTNDAAKAEENLAQARAKGVLASADLLSRQAAAHENNLALQTEQQVDDRITAITREIAANDAAIKALIASGDTTEEVTTALNNYRQKNAELRAEYLDLDLVVRDAVATKEKEIKLAEYEKRQKEELIATTQKYNDDVTRLTEDGLKRSADLYGQYSDHLVNLATQAADAADTALQKLGEDRAKLVQDFGRDELDAQQQAQLDALDAQIQFQREDARALREHERNLKAIRDRAADSELEAIADRDFRSLFFQRRQTARELSNASQTFVDEGSERAIAAQEAGQDRVRQAAAERAERLTNYQRQLNDLQSNFNKENDQIARNLAKQRDLAKRKYDADVQELATNLSNQLTIRRNAAVAELNLISKTEQERLRITNEGNAALLRQAAQMANEFSRIFSGSRLPALNPTNDAAPLRRRALGGSLSAGHSAIVNEAGSSRRESFTAGGQTVALPGFGVFTASKGGQVNANQGGGGITLHQTINISGTDPNRMMDVIDQRTMYLMNKALGIKHD